MSIVKKFIGADQVDGAKLLLLNNQALRAKEAGGAAVDILKVTSGDVLEIQKLPRVSSSAPAVSDDKDLVTKEYVESVLGGGAGNGYAPLGVDGKIPNQYYSSLVITDVFVVADIAARDALTGIEEGDVAKVTDAGAGLPKTYIFAGLPTGWIEIESGSDVDSVNGFTGSVVLQTGDVAESGATNRYYTPTRQSAIEAYADQAEADAITSANSYTDGEISTLQTALEAEDLTFLKLDGSRPMTGQLNMGANNIYTQGEVQGDSLTLFATAEHLNLVANPTKEIRLSSSSGGQIDAVFPGGGKLRGLSAFSGTESSDTAAPKGYVDGEISTVYTDMATEDLTFVKLDGSRPMQGSLNFDDTFDINGVVQVNAVRAAFSDYVEVANQLTFTSTGSIQFGMSDGVINGLAAFTGAEDAAQATPKSYVDSQKTAAVSEAGAYTDGQLDLLSVQELVHESKTLGAGDLISISVADAIQGQPWIQVGRVSLVPGDDFTVSGSTITWAGSVAAAGAEALEAGDKVSIFYMKSVQPYV